MSDDQPQPISPSRQPKICPICGKASYSAAGIHPQCAVKQADEKRKVELQKEKTEKKKTEKPSKVSRWQKTCPRCKLVQHVRKKTCVCGYEFSAKSPAQPDDDL